MQLHIAQNIRTDLIRTVSIQILQNKTSTGKKPREFYIAIAYVRAVTEYRKKNARLFHNSGLP